MLQLCSGIQFKILIQLGRYKMWSEAREESENHPLESKNFEKCWSKLLPFTTQQHQLQTQVLQWKSDLIFKSLFVLDHEQSAGRLCKIIQQSVENVNRIKLRQTCQIVNDMK